MNEVNSCRIFKRSGHISLILMGLVFTNALQAEIYKWTDEQGITHYSENRPKKGKIQNIRLKSKAAKSSPEIPELQENFPTPKFTPASKIKVYSGKKGNLPGLNIGNYGAKNSLAKTRPEKIHNESFENVHIENANFHKKSLWDVKFDDAQLSSANFSKAILNPEVSFKGANLVKADFSRAEMSRVYFSNADLTDGNFENAFCNECNFDQAKLSNASLKGMGLYKTSFINTNLKGVVFDHSGVWSNVSFIGAKGLDYDALFEIVKHNPSGMGDIRYDYNGCVIGVTSTDCSNKDLSGHKFFNNSDLINMNLKKANLQNADLSLTRLIDSNVSNANLKGATLGYIKNSDFSYSNLSSATINAGSTRNSFVIPKSINMRHANLTEANLEGMRLNAFDLMGADLTGIKFTSSLASARDFKGAKIEGCESCKKMLQTLTISAKDVEGVIQEVIRTPTKDKYAKTLFGNKRWHFSYSTFMTGRSSLNEDETAKLIELMLGSKSKELINDAAKLADKLFNQGYKKMFCSRTDFTRSLRKYLKVNDNVNNRVRHNFTSCLEMN